MAAAAFAATSGLVDLVGRWDRAFFEGFGDESVYGSGDALEGVLCSVEGLDARVATATGAEVLETINFGFVQLLTSAVELLELVAESHHFAVESDGVFVSQEGFCLVAGRADGRIIGNGFTKLGEAEFDGLGKGAGHREGG